ncbi:hypothetical protein MPER_08919 [Moniliophthora perniciosa FA553]|nr:hypothetical protein MPER_08919 [Moniliophthora perniciosa FA553]
MSEIPYLGFGIVKRFIKERSQSKTEIKDRLHAIWFCIEIPTENAALFEQGDEKILKLDLDNIPIVVVFTKYDALVRKLEKESEGFHDLDDDEPFQDLSTNNRGTF